MDLIYSLKGPEALTEELDTIKETNPGLFKWLGGKVDSIGEKVIIGISGKGLMDLIKPYFT